MWVCPCVFVLFASLTVFPLISAPGPYLTTKFLMWNRKCVYFQRGLKIYFLMCICWNVSTHKLLIYGRKSIYMTMTDDDAPRFSTGQNLLEKILRKDKS